MPRRQIVITCERGIYSAELLSNSRTVWVATDAFICPREAFDAALREHDKAVAGGW